MGDGKQENRSGSEQSRGSNGKEGRNRESESPDSKRAEGDREYSGEEEVGRTEGFVYFIETHDSAFVKIGYSADALRRFTQLQLPGARLLGVMPGTRVTEGWLHRKFAELRRNGEWFRHGVQIRDFIGAVGLMKPEPSKKKNAVAQAFVAMRNNKLSPERRKEIASKAAKKRWEGTAKP